LLRTFVAIALGLTVKFDLPRPPARVAELAGHLQRVVPTLQGEAAILPA
jgi:hypothetical protein